MLVGSIPHRTTISVRPGKGNAPVAGLAAQASIKNGTSHAICAIQKGAHTRHYYSILISNNKCRPAERRPAQVGSEPDPLPPAALLHGGLHPPDQPRQSAVPRPQRARADSADVGCQEHDVRCGPPPRTLPDRLRSVPWTHVLQGGTLCPFLCFPLFNSLTAAPSCCALVTCTHDATSTVSCTAVWQSLLRKYSGTV